MKESKQSIWMAVYKQLAPHLSSSTKQILCIKLMIVPLKKIFVWKYENIFFQPLEARLLYSSIQILCVQLYWFLIESPLLSLKGARSWWNCNWSILSPFSDLHHLPRHLQEAIARLVYFVNIMEKETQNLNICTRWNIWLVDGLIMLCLQI